MRSRQIEIHAINEHPFSPRTQDPAAAGWGLALRTAEVTEATEVRRGADAPTDPYCLAAWANGDAAALWPWAGFPRFATQVKGA